MTSNNKRSHGSGGGYNQYQKALNGNEIILTKVFHIYKQLSKVYKMDEKEPEELDVSALLAQICNKLDRFEKKLADLTLQTQKLGVACAQAFGQVKTVVEHLTEVVDLTRQDLSEYGGTIRDSTWDV